MMTGPTNLNPRFLRALDISSDSGVLPGTSPVLKIGFPPVMFQIKLEKPSPAVCIAR
jgi:hypothetical protein